MPTYEYKCANCGHAFEKFQSIMAAPIKRCPKCKKNTAKRLIGTGAGLIFKGSGFYITDYRSEGYKEKAKADTAGGGESKSSDTKTETKAASDTKPAAKSETSKTETKPAPKSDSKPAKKDK